MDFMSKRKIFFGLSIGIILIGIIGTIVYGGLNQGIDFVGGTLLQIDFGEKIPVNEVKTITDEFDQNASIIHTGDNQKQIIIRTKVELDENARKEVFEKFKAKYNLEDAALIEQDKFGAKIGDEIKRDAIISVIIATIGILLYITFRFEFRFGISAIVALVHDVLIALTVYSLFRIPINSSFVAAMLTIVGYSINDTIVVFDRIRENLKSVNKRDYKALVNDSISQTLVRSINTSFTTLIAIVTLYILGVEAIRDFALPLIVGVLAGTYSSIFIASPVWFMLKKKAA